MAPQLNSTRRKPARRTATAKRASSNGHAAAATLEDARHVTRGTYDAALEGVRGFTRAALRGGETLMGAGDTPVTAANADVTDEIEKGGPAFGSFLKSIGLAVAESQRQLDDDLAKTAEALSKQEINVIAIWEQQLDDDGMMKKGNPVVQKLPLINYLMPTAYNFSRVYLQADMSVSEFNAANGFNIQGHSASVGLNVNGSYGPMGASVGGSLSANASLYSQSVNTSSSVDSAAGKLHMEATLEPRADIRLPQPFVVQKGPQLRVIVGSQADIMDANDTTKVVGRKVSITAKLTGTTGAASGKTFDIKLTDPSLGFTILSANGQTDNNGELKFDVTRTGAAFDPSRPAHPATCKVWLNLLSQDVAFNI